jgi:hypothetical protein
VIRNKVVSTEVVAGDGGNFGGDRCAVGLCIRDCKQDSIGFGDLVGGRFWGNAKVEDWVG